MMYKYDYAASVYRNVHDYLYIAKPKVVFVESCEVGRPFVRTYHHDNNADDLVRTKRHVP